MMKMLLVGGILLGLTAVYLLLVTLVPGFEKPGPKLAGRKSASPDNDRDTRQEVIFTVKGTPVSAWFYPSENAPDASACVVMANGLGGTKDMLLEQYTRRFQAAGMAVISFDYRHFGTSGGQPRQLIWIPYQLEDYAAAVAYARGLEQVDSQRVALWGTSLSGGHVITMAARDNDIACVVAQCPGVDGRASAKAALKRFGLRHLLRMVMNGQRDYFRGLLGLSPHKIPIVAEPGSTALMATPDVMPFFEQYAPEGYLNEACARIVIRGDKYRPIKYAKDVRCPVLMQVCKGDAMVPLSAARETERLLGTYAEARYYPIGHFDIYVGKHFERAVNEQLAFFKKHLRL